MPQGFRSIVLSRGFQFASGGHICTRVRPRRTADPEVARILGGPLEFDSRLEVPAGALMLERQAAPRTMIRSEGA